MALVEKHILIANIFGIGDVLFTTPLIASLKKEIPGLSVDCMCNARTKAILENNPDIDDIFVYEKDDYVKLWSASKRSFLSKLSALFFAIRRKKYHAVLDLTLSRKFGFLFMIAGISKRIGLNYKKRGTFLTHKTELVGFEGKHVVEFYLDLLKHLGVSVSVGEMKLVPNEYAREWARRYLHDKGVNPKKFIAIIPGGGASWGIHAARKRWGSEGFAKVANELMDASIPVIVLGSTKEKRLCEEVIGKLKKAPVCALNDLDLEKYVALLEMAGLVLCNDGGPLHIAVALGVKTVSLFGPVDEKVYGPYPESEKHKVITVGGLDCRPCYRRFKLPECDNDNRCVTDIDQNEVAKVCMELFYSE
jgi:lipopolysaccharide heptosyltransferase II